jgi:hypothetical protein
LKGPEEHPEHVVVAQSDIFPATGDTLMPDENDNRQTPQPILIHGGEVEASGNDPTAQYEASQPTPTEPVGSPDDANATSDLAEAIEHYEALKSKSDPGNGLIAISFTIMAVSLFIGISAAIDGFSGGGGTGEGAELCCGGLLIGALFGAGGLAQSSSYEREVKKALAEVKSLADVGLPKKKVMTPVLTTGLIMSVLGFSITNAIESAVGPLLFLVGLFTLCAWVLGLSPSEKPEDVLAAAKKELLRRNE